MRVASLNLVVIGSLFLSVVGCEDPACAGEDCPCVSSEDCSKRPECATATVCLDCEQGGDCSFSGLLTVLGEVKSGGAVVSGVRVVARCGTSEIETQPDALGAFVVELDVSDCERLTVQFTRESYVPAIRTLPMPPPVSHVAMKVDLQRGVEVLCGSDECASEDSGRTFSGGSGFGAARGWAYNSDSLEAIASIGGRFESNAGELLLLHSFSFRHWYDENGDVLPLLPSVHASCHKVDGSQRDWIADMYDLDEVTDYHSFEYSDTYLKDYLTNGRFDTPEEAEAAYNEHIDEFRDDEIDPDGDGFYDGIEMTAYELDGVSGRWLEQQHYAEINAKPERQYSTYAGIYSPRLELLRVPSLYLADVQARVPFGPGAWEKNTQDDADGGGVYGDVWGCLPTPGSGIYAYGQPMSTACLRVIVLDACDQPVAGAPVEVTGDDHGFHANDLSDDSGISCINVARTESVGANLDGDTLTGEKFNVNVRVEPPVGFSGGRRVDIDTVEAPAQEGDCAAPQSCGELVARISTRECEQSAAP